jgi:outer membrane protein TolC
MWQVGLAVALPSWSVVRQRSALEELEARARLQASARASAEALVVRRSAERRAALRALVATNRLHRSGLLVQSEATVTSTLAQYQVGKVTFASVLDALRGYLDDVETSLESFAAAQQVAIAERAASLEGAPGLPPVPSSSSDAPPMSGGPTPRGM